MKRDKLRALFKAINEKDAGAVRAFCRDNTVPDYQDVRRKESLWLNDAIHYGTAEIVEILLAHGLDVNPELVTRRTSNMPYDQPPLTYAISGEHDDIVRLLLKRGANPNADRPLVSAVNPRKPTDRQLLYLKLLIEHGADVNQLYRLYDSDTQFTVLEWTHDPEVKEYLLSQGAKTSAELLSESSSVESLGKSLSQRKEDAKVVREHLTEVVDFFRSEFGELDAQTFSDTLLLGTGATVHVIKPKVAGEPITLFTTGLSAHSMNVPQELVNEAAYAELYMQLPSDWNLGQQDPQWSWPIQYILDMANYPIPNDVCFLPPVTCIENGEPPEPLGPNVKFTSTALLALKTFERSDGKTINCYCLMPIYEAEHRMVKRQGVPSFLKALDNNDVSRILDIDRPSVA